MKKPSHYDHGYLVCDTEGGQHTWRGEPIAIGSGVSSTWVVAFCEAKQEWRVVHVPTGRGLGIGMGLDRHEAIVLGDMMVTVDDRVGGKLGGEMIFSKPETEARMAFTVKRFNRELLQMRAPPPTAPDPE